MYLHGALLGLLLLGQSATPVPLAEQSAIESQQVGQVQQLQEGGAQPAIEVEQQSAEESTPDEVRAPVEEIATPSPVDVSPQVSTEQEDSMPRSFDLPSWVTALSTVALVGATVVLAIFTWFLADRTGKPQVVATLESNQWAMNFLDLRIENTGNATAFDIRVSFEPPLPTFKEDPKDGEAPLSRVSLLRPGQSMNSSQCEFQRALKDVYTAKVSWTRHPQSRRRDTLSYQIDLAGVANRSSLGSVSPEIQLATELKNIREDWKAIAHRQKRLLVDIYSSEDREEERRRRDEQFAELRAARNASEKGTETD